MSKFSVHAHFLHYIISQLIEIFSTKDSLVYVPFPVVTFFVVLSMAVHTCDDYFMCTLSDMGSFHLFFYFAIRGIYKKYL